MATAASTCMIWSGRSPWQSLTAMSKTLPLFTFVLACSTCASSPGLRAALTSLRRFANHHANVSAQEQGGGRKRRKAHPCKGWIQ